MSRIRTERERPRRRTLLDPLRKSPLAERFEAELLARVVGQDHAVQELSSLYEMALAGLNTQDRPIGTMLLLGPMGSGKTWLAESAAEVLYGSSQALIKIDCAEYQQPHEVAKITHAVPAPLLSQEAIDRSDRNRVPLSLILFDDVEKASPVLWQLLLSVLDHGTLTLADGRRVDFRRAIVLVSSNLGANEILAGVSGGIGFAVNGNAAGQSDLAGVDDRVRRAAIETASRQFSPEFMNRIDKTVVFQPISGELLHEVLDRELEAVQRRILRDSATKLTLQYSADARERLMSEGMDRRYGARHLKRAIDRLVLTPLARFITSGQVGFGDTIDVQSDLDSGELVFHRMSAAEWSATTVAPGIHVTPATADPQERDRQVALAVATAVAVSAAVGLATGLTAAGLPLRRSA